MNFQTELINKLRNGGNNIAIESGDTKLSYEDLLNKSNHIAGYLLNQGLTKETPVGVCMDNRADMIAAIIGIALAGGVFVPVDTTLPLSRLQIIRKELDLTILITDQQNIEAKISGVEAHMYAKITDTTILDSDLVFPETNGEDSLYIYFTSGSTGVPKGIVGKNKSLSQFIQWEINEFGISSKDRFSQFVSPYFDAFLRDVFVPIFSGATCCIPPSEEGFFTPETMQKWVEENAISHIHCVPSIFRVLKDIQLSETVYPSLKYVFLSGEKIIPSELVSWYDSLGNRIQLVNFYGATESTMIRAFYRIQPADASKSRIPIGSPIGDTELLIANQGMKPCPPLTVGDLYIISEFLSKGYLNNQELTAAKFITLNKGTDQEKAAFATGDKARKLANGLIELLGRDDRQVKIRGIRVELDEIENTIIQSGLVDQIVVVYQEDTVDDAQMIAFVVPGSETADSTRLSEQLTSICEQNLPAYMVPNRFESLQAFPLLNNGKIDIKALLENQKEAVRETKKPVNPTEEQLLAIWNEILPNKEFSTQDNFLNQGGNSLSIMRLIGKIYKTFDVRVSLSDLFKNLTIEQQARLILEQSKDDVFTIKKAENKELFVLTAAQERIFYNYELNKSSTAYNLPMVWEITKDADVNQIKRVFQQLIDKHEALRTGFRYTEEGVRQFIVPNLVFSVETIDSTDQGSVAEQKAIQDFIRPFNLNEPGLMRAGIITMSNHKKLLVMDVHHIVCDGMSQMNLLSDFITLYNGETIAPLAIRYVDYAEWEATYRQSAEYVKQREFWLQCYEKDAPSLQLPVKEESKSLNSGIGDNLLFSIDKTTVQPVLNCLKDQNVTDFAALFTVFFLFLSELSGQNDIVIGTNTSGRIQSEVEPLVGMFVKTLPIRINCGSESTFEDLLLHVHNTLVKANNSQLFDLIDILKQVGKENVDSSGLFEAMFVYQNFEKISNQLKDGVFSAYDFESNTFKYPISLFAQENEQQLNFRLEYSSDYFAKSDAVMLIERYKSLILRIASDTSITISELMGNETQASSIDETAISFNF